MVNIACDNNNTSLVGKVDSFSELKINKPLDDCISD